MSKHCRFRMPTEGGDRPGEHHHRQNNRGDGSLVNCRREEREREREGESCNKRPTHRHLSLSLSLNIYVYIKERNTGFTDGGVDGRTSIFALLLRLLLPFVCMYVCDDCGFGKARAHMYTSQRISRTHHACVSRI